LILIFLGITEPSKAGLADIVDIAIENFAFDPNNIVIEVGTTIRWTNNDAAEHTSTSDDAVWNSPLLGQGDDFTHTFLASGTYPYHCIPHPFMTASITVVAPSEVVDVSIPELFFDPDDISIVTGTAVTWTNNHDVIHTTTSNGGFWDSGDLAPGEDFTYLFMTAGDFPYLCTIHPFMTANVTVTEPKTLICADTDGNEIFDILDIILLIDFKFKEGPPPESMEVADTDNNGIVDILDIIVMIDFKFKEGPPPDCGF
jgi:plastocyanin